MNILISGASGAMGQVLIQLIQESTDHHVVAGFAEQPSQEEGFAIVDDLAQVTDPVDVVIDFSLPSSLPALLDYCKQASLPLVIATTGYSEQEENRIKDAGQDIPILFAKNMSVGINMMEKIVALLAQALSQFDIEIVEKHHRYKKDAPSGTAKMLVEACQQGRPQADQVIEGRSGHSEGRSAEEIGVAALRGGTIVGEHTAIFAGEDEVLEIKHVAQSKKIFANGAIQAAEFLVDQAPGLYDMNDVLGG